MSDPGSKIAVAFARETMRTANGQLCRACTEVLDVTGVGITLMFGTQAGPICVTGPVAELEEIQFTAGEGPCRDAYTSGVPVNCPQLDGVASRRWPAFVDLARDSGIEGVFAYPLRRQGVGIGVLTVYQAAAGDLSVEQHDDSLMLADVLFETLLSVQDEARPGELADGLGEAVQYRAEIYQASGMIAARHGIPAADALVRLRGAAFSAGRDLRQLASDIVTRRVPVDDF